MKLQRSLVLLFLLCFAAPVNAVVLRGLVSEVSDGKSVVITSSNRKLTVVLRGVAAPELKQEYGDMARQHLASLILDKEVAVDITEFKVGHVVGKVICNQMDIGLQVIRDGAAWYDKNGDHNLSEAERRTYAEAEQAARTEQRGLWQGGSPSRPGESRLVEVATQSNPVTHKTNRGKALDTEDLLFIRKRSLANSKDRGDLEKPSLKPLNRPGLDFDFRHYLTQGRVSIVYFYADWCPACRQMGPVMDGINARVPDMQVLFMDIGEWNTPITQKYGVTSIPHLKIYDKTGNLIAEGKAARSWLQQAVR
jgi:endonuclease YncB( thermonuclease family)/thiol-disulfide isomerase/thioredoxin